MKLGNMIIPDTSLEACLTVATKIYEKSEGKAVSRTLIADYLKQKPGGAFNRKIASCKRYGLIEGRKNTYQITEVGKQATFPKDDAEKQAAILKAVRNIELWQKLLDKDVSPDSVNFLSYLIEITGAERSVANADVETVRDAYLNDVALIKSGGEPQKEPSNEVKEGVGFAGGAPEMDEETTDATTAIVKIEHPIFQSRIVIKERNYNSFNALLHLLNALKKSLDIKEEEASNNEILDMLKTINSTLKLKGEREQAASENKGEG